MRIEFCSNIQLIGKLYVIQIRLLDINNKTHLLQCLSFVSINSRLNPGLLKTCVSHDLILVTLDPM